MSSTEGVKDVVNPREAQRLKSDSCKVGDFEHVKDEGGTPPPTASPRLAAALWVQQQLALFRRWAGVQQQCRTNVYTEGTQNSWPVKHRPQNQNEGGVGTGGCI